MGGLDQAIIGICGIATVFLTQDLRHSRRRLACFFGLAAQPFWLYTAATHEQWGIFVLSLVYTVGWLRGFHNHWINKHGTLQDG